jgi:hypothetical protein
MACFLGDDSIVLLHLPFPVRVRIDDESAGQHMVNADENRATWQHVLDFVAEYPDNEYWNRWKAIVSPILERAVELEYDSLFRAGMSVNHVIFSTLDHHGLRDEPRVTFEVMKDWSIRISLTTNNVWFREPTQFAVMDELSAFPTLQRYLWHLWEETVPEPVPDRLRSDTQLHHGRND